MACSYLTGGPCTSYSLMGKQKREADPVVATHRAYFRNVKQSDVDVVIWENVTEYDDKLLRRGLGAGWTIERVHVDPRLFGLSVARARCYILAIRREVCRWNPLVPTMQELLDSLTRDPRMTASSYFWIPRSEVPAESLRLSDPEAGGVFS